MGRIFPITSKRVFVGLPEQNNLACPRSAFGSLPRFEVSARLPSWGRCSSPASPERPPTEACNRHRRAQAESIVGSASESSASTADRLGHSNRQRAGELEQKKLHKLRRLSTTKQPTALFSPSLLGAPSSHRDSAGTPATLRLSGGHQRQHRLSLGRDPRRDLVRLLSSIYLSRSFLLYKRAYVLLLGRRTERAHSDVCRVPGLT